MCSVADTTAHGSWSPTCHSDPARSIQLAVAVDEDLVDRRSSSHRRAHRAVSVRQSRQSCRTRNVMINDRGSLATRTRSRLPERPQGRAGFPRRPERRAPVRHRPPSAIGRVHGSARFPSAAARAAEPDVCQIARTDHEQREVGDFVQLNRWSSAAGVDETSGHSAKVDASRDH